MNELSFLEFFAGGGMARLGLGPDWRCAFANDFDAAKGAAYAANFGAGDFHLADIHGLGIADLPAGAADLAWASFPCQDLSLAGARAGLGAPRSGAFFGFRSIIGKLADAGRRPRSIVVENVAGLLTSNGGRDLARLVGEIARAGYYVSAIVLNARDFVPQSRPRLFIVGLENEGAFSRTAPAIDAAAPAALHKMAAGLPAPVRRRWRWISARPAARRNLDLIDIIDDGAPFDAKSLTQARVNAMAPRQRAALDALIAAGGRHVGAAFRRVRVEGGRKIVRIEARFDGVAGCLRTPAGGSSRQIIFDIDDAKVRSRLMTPREAARAMGLPDEYRLPQSATGALKLIGDGVSPPVVAWLARNVLEPALLRVQKAA
ncbi:MAG: DNA cytosine methyltransferase [Parvularculaceae bacterium]|nr:DNA cytosine methyltransferase [Parvularculaceae bacterium]